MLQLFACNASVAASHVLQRVRCHWPFHIVALKWTTETTYSAQIHPCYRSSSQSLYSRLLWTKNAWLHPTPHVYPSLVSAPIISPIQEGFPCSIPSRCWSPEWPNLEPNKSRVSATIPTYTVSTIAFIHLTVSQMDITRLRVFITSHPNTKNRSNFSS